MARPSELDEVTRAGVAWRINQWFADEGRAGRTAKLDHLAAAIGVSRQALAKARLGMVGEGVAAKLEAWWGESRQVWIASAAAHPTTESVLRIIDGALQRGLSHREILRRVKRSLNHANDSQRAAS